MLKIDNLSIPSRCILAPLSGVSDLPFRIISRSFGCELAFLEMINARALVYQVKKTRKMTLTSPDDKPLGIQLLGSEPEMIRRAMDIVNEYDFDIIDFNAGCPARKANRRGEGAALLKDPKKLRDLLKIIVSNTKKPVTVKIRSGWDEDSVNAKDTALYSEDAGIKALFIHGRTKTQGYKGNVDYKIIKEVKDVLNIPVIASGDILSAKLAKRMLTETGCDGIILARGAMGNPWLFEQINRYLKEGTESPAPDTEELISIMTRHLDLCMDFYDEKIGILVYRKFFHLYTKTIHRIKFLRSRAFHSKTKKEMLDMIALVREHKDKLKFLKAATSL